MTERDEVALRGVRVWPDVAALSGLTDRELLDRFAAGGGHTAQVAFAAPVARHGPMVLRAWRATLRDRHDACGPRPLVRNGATGVYLISRKME